MRQCGVQAVLTKLRKAWMQDSFGSRQCHTNLKRQGCKTVESLGSANQSLQDPDPYIPTPDESCSLPKP